MQKLLNVKTGDTVVVITGKDAGKKGKVLASYPTKNRVVVEGVNMITKHQKPRSAQDKGGIIKKEGTIDVSNVMIICPSCGKATRVKHTLQDGKMVRVCKCGTVLDKKYSQPTKKSAKAEEKSSAKKADKKVENKPETKTAPKAVKATGTNKSTARVQSTAKKGDA